jgi:hypothetical protein
VIDAPAIWQQLRIEGRVDDDRPPAADASTRTPWVARLLTGAAAWIATPLLLAFVAMLLGDLLADAWASLVIGAILCAAMVLPLRQSGGEFLHQGATIISVVGIVLVGFGLSEGVEVSETVVALALLSLSAVLFVASRVPVHQFMCAGILVFATLWLLDGTSSARLSLLQPLTAWVAVAVWWLGRRIDPHVRWCGHAAPLAWVLTLTAIGLAWFHSVDTLDLVDPTVMAGARYIGAALLPATALAVGIDSLRAGDRWLFMLLVAISIILAWLWRWSPGITVGLSLMLVAFARGNVVLLAVAVISLAVYLVAYYFQLAVPLLVKALWLGIAGAVLAAAHIVLRRWPVADRP